MSLRIPALSVSFVLALGALSGCAAGNGNGDIEGPVTVYVSMPLSGPQAAQGRDAANGARLAAEATPATAEIGVEVKVLDGTTPDRMVAAAANARTATQDSSTAVYIGELDSAPTRNSLPILNDAGLAQISPTAGADDLTSGTEEFENSPGRYRPSGEATFARLAPGDERVATASGGAGAGRVEAVLDPSSLGPGGQEFVADFTSRFKRPPGPYAAYGYVTMQLAIESIEKAAGTAEGFRARVVDELLSATLTDTLLGDFGIENDGNSTICLVQPYAGDRPLKPVCAPPA